MIMTILNLSYVSNIHEFRPKAVFKSLVYGSYSTKCRVPSTISENLYETIGWTKLSR